MPWFKSRQPKPRGAALGSGLRRLSRVEHLESRIALSVSPVGAEFQANTETAWSQQTSGQAANAVAMDADGNYVVTWMSERQDGSSFGVYAQRYSAAGFKQGAEFRVNTTTVSNQAFSSVAMDAEGNFVVIWTNSKPGEEGIYFQRFTAAGQAQGGEVQVGDSAGPGSRASVAMQSNGEFVIAWNGDGIRAQRFNADGTTKGSEFRAGNGGSDVRAAVNDNGDLVLIWTGEIDASYYGVYGRRYNANNNAQGGVFRVAGQWQPAVAMDADGGFVVVSAIRGRESGWGVYARRYSPSGQPLDELFRVNTETANNQWYPGIAMAPSGEFVVTWMSHYQDGPTSYGIYGQRFLADGTRDGGEFLVNTERYSDQEFPHIAMDPTGGFVVVWSSKYQDGDRYGVFGQRFGNDHPAVNVGPEFTGRVGNPRTTVGEALSYRFPAGAFTDGNMGDTLTYTATLSDGSPLPAWLNFNPATRVFSGTPGSGEAGQYAIRLTATDSQSQIASTEMTVYVSPLGNESPELVGRIGNPRGNAGEPFEYRFSRSAFVDPNGDAISYTAELVGGAPLPGWLSFDAANRRFYGTPAVNDAGTYEVRLLATDEFGAFTQTNFAITIGGAGNVAPALTGRIGNPTATEGSPFQYRFSQSAFTDADGDPLTYTARLANGNALPGWLTFNAADRSFSGTPQASDVGVYELRVTATDPQGASASTDLTLTVRSDASNRSRYALAADFVFGSEFT